MRFVRRWMRRPTLEQQMREEMRFHLESRIETLVARGMPAKEAARVARLEFGSLDAHQEECRAAMGFRPFDEIRADLRYAARNLRKQPGYAAAVITILAVAIGVNSAFFTLFSHHVLKPLAIRGADRHFDLVGLDAQMRPAGGWTTAEIELLRRAGQHSVEGLYSARTVQALVLAPSQRLSAVSFVSGNYFRLLGGTAALGRTFDEPEQREPVAVLSNSGRRRFFADGVSPIGKTIRVRGVVLTVLGVMPAEFTGTDAVVPDLWVGAELHQALLGPNDNRDRRYSLSGLLAPGVSRAQAEAVLTASASRFPRPPEQQVKQLRLNHRRGVLAADDDLQVAAGVVFAAFLSILVIACANLANLSLARAAWRTHEIGMRLSLGASRPRVVRQLLTESALTALLGAAGGVALGIVAIHQAEQYLAPLAIGMGFVLAPVNADWRTMLFSAGLGLAAGVAFGLLPAIEMTAPALAASVRREHSPFAGRVRPRRMRNALIAGQVAASLVLLMIAGILTGHMQTLHVTSTGYDLDRVFDLKVDRPEPSLLAVLERQPGVAAVSGVRQVPLYGMLPQATAAVGEQTARISYNYVDHRYFEALALPIEGRGFTPPEAATNARVVVISEATATRLWPGMSALGQAMKIEGLEASGVYEVIGVAPDVISGWLFRGKDATAVYLPAAAGQEQIQSAMVRIHGDRRAVMAEVRRACAASPDAIGCEPASLREVSDIWRFPFAAAACVTGSLGALALLLTAVGLYSVTSYSLLQRRREMGMHLALGASTSQLIWSLVREALLCIGAGVGLGLPICLLVSGAMRASVFGIHAFDPRAYGAAPLLLAVIVTLACVIPASRATRMDPMASLREE